MNKADKKAVIKEFLEDIKEKIELIDVYDDGMGSCLYNFCEGVNDKLEQYGLILVLNPCNNTELSVEEMIKP